MLSRGDHQRKLDRKNFAECLSAKIGSLQNFQPYGTMAARAYLAESCPLSSVSVHKYYVQSSFVGEIFQD